MPASQAVHAACPNVCRVLHLGSVREAIAEIAKAAQGDRRTAGPMCRYSRESSACRVGPTRYGEITHALRGRGSRSARGMAPRAPCGAVLLRLRTPRLRACRCRHLSLRRRASPECLTGRRRRWPAWCGERFASRRVAEYRGARPDQSAPATVSAARGRGADSGNCRRDRHANEQHGACRLSPQRFPIGATRPKENA